MDPRELGLGSYRLTDSDGCVSAVETASDVGYRRVDTAEYYGNEAPVGEGVASSPVDRDDVFLATKV